MKLIFIIVYSFIALILLALISVIAVFTRLLFNYDLSNSKLVFKILEPIEII